MQTAQKVQRLGMTSIWVRVMPFSVHTRRLFLAMLRGFFAGFAFGLGFQTLLPFVALTVMRQ